MKHRFLKAIQGKDKIALIAEIKRKSPSYGTFLNLDDISIETYIRAYELGGANAISVVTEAKLFGGSLDLLKHVRRLTRLPILRKDFIQSIKQVDETADSADALLLIARKLSATTLKQLILRANKNGLDCVVEIYDQSDLQKIKNLPEIIVGINNRNLQTFQTDVNHARDVLKKIDKQKTIIAESAFQNTKELKPYFGFIDAILIGTALLTSINPQHKLTQFINACCPK